MRRYAGSALDALAYDSGSRGRGTIRFGPAQPFFGYAGRNWAIWNGASLDCFVAVPAAVRVYELILAARRT